MAEEPIMPADPRALLSLKLFEAEVSTDDPWGDDKLGRKELAQRLTDIVSGQTAPFVISIHGGWGTGKTFMLKRWQKELEGKNTSHGPKYKAIYFNAWDDDFCDDPLLAIIGQLANYFRGSALMTYAQQVAHVGAPLLRANINGVLNRFTGLTLDASSFTPKVRDLPDEYRQQRETKDALKQRLAELATKVVEETGHPLIFIIAELDRCRPTFAIELLERVKHIFEVPNIVFALGINRDELCKSLKSVYGDIDADTYFRRFFDLEFNLPPVDAPAFGKYLMQRYELWQFFTSLSEEANHPAHLRDFKTLEENFPAIWARLGLSLREIDYCVRSIAMVGRNTSLRQPMLSWWLGVLIPLQMKNSTLYKKYIEGECLGSEVINYLDKNLLPDDENERSRQTLWMIEAFFYFADQSISRSPYALSILPKNPAAVQLEALERGESLTNREYLSELTQVESGNSHKVQFIKQRLQILDQQINEFPRNIVAALANQIELHEGFIRR